MLLTADTLSRVAVVTSPSLEDVTAIPAYTFVAIVTETVLPVLVQVDPSADM